MADVLIYLLPLIVGAAVVPLYPVAVLLLLQSERGLAKAVAFVFGVITVRIAQGILFGLLFEQAVGAEPDGGQGPVVSTLLLVVGLLLLVAGLRKWRKVEEPDAPPPQWMNALSNITIPRAVGAGAFYVTIAVKQWVFTLSALGVIAEAGLAGTANVILYLFFVLATQVLVLPPLLAYAIAPLQSEKPLRAAQRWLETHNRAIVVVVSLVFGTWFLYKGIDGLIG